MATGYLDPHPRRALSVLEFTTSQGMNLVRTLFNSFQTSWFSNSKWKSIKYFCSLAGQKIHLHAYICNWVHIHTGILWPYHLKIASYSPVVLWWPGWDTPTLLTYMTLLTYYLRHPPGTFLHVVQHSYLIYS